MRLLLDAGADPGRADGDGATPLMLAAGEGQLEVLRLLLGRGTAVDVSQLDTVGFTAFHYACYSNQPECAEALVRAGCNDRIQDGEGSTGRELAEAKGHAAVVERLRAVVAQQLQLTPKLVAAAPEGDAAAAGGL